MSNECHPSSTPRCSTGRHAQSKTLGPLVPSRAREALPGVVRKQEGRDIAALHPPYAEAGLDHHGFVTGNGSDIPILMGFQPVAYVLLAPIDRVADHPFYRDSRLVDALHHLDGEFWFGAKGDDLGNASLASASRIVHPILGQVQVAINQGMAKG